MVRLMTDNDAKLRRLMGWRAANSVNCPRCGKQRDARDSYCRACRAQYMRAWRKTKILVSREAWERLTEGRSA